MDMADDTTAQRAAGGDRRHRPDGAATAVAALASREAGEQPPDVIDVVFPAPGAAGTGHAAGGTVGGTGTGHGRRERLRDRPLLLAAVSIAAVAVAAVIAWQVWPRSPGTTTPDRPDPLPSSAQPLDTGGISGRAAGPLPSAGGHTGRAPDADGDPTRKPAPSTEPSAGIGTASPAPATPSNATSAPPATPSGSPTPSGTAPAPRTLRAGDSGPDVTDLQRLLFAQGFTYVSLTGVYDDATVRGVTQVQRDRGLTCDPIGVYGPCTRAAMAP